MCERERSKPTLRGYGSTHNSALHPPTAASALQPTNHDVASTHNDNAASDNSSPPTGRRKAPVVGFAQHHRPCFLARRSSDTSSSGLIKRVVVSRMSDKANDEKRLCGIKQTFHELDSDTTQSWKSCSFRNYIQRCEEKEEEEEVTRERMLQTY